MNAFSHDRTLQVEQMEIYKRNTRISTIKVGWLVDACKDSIVHFRLYVGALPLLICDNILGVIEGNSPFCHGRRETSSVVLLNYSPDWEHLTAAI